MTSIEQQVRVRAYHIWEEDGRVLGRAEAHWLRAEAEFVSQDIAGIDAALPLSVQPVAAATSDAPSPAKVLKTRAAKATGSGARAVSAKADAAAHAGAEKAASAAKTPAAKTPAPKPLATKAKTAKSAPRSTAATSVALH